MASESKQGNELAKQTKIYELTKESELKYRRLFEAAQDGIIIIEADSGRTMDVNPFLLNMLGYTSKELIGKRLWEIGLFKDIAANKIKFAELQSKKYVRYEDLPLETKSGIKKHVEFVSNVYLVGKTRIIQCNIRDIEDRIKAEEEVNKLKSITEDKIKDSELKFRRLFEAAQDGILIIDADSGKIMDVNPFLMDMLGYTAKEFVGKRLWEIGLFKDIAANKNKFAELQSKKYVRYEDLPLETKSGKKRHVEFVSNVYIVGKTRIIQCNIRDIEDRIKAEEEVNKLKSITEDKIKESELRYRRLFEAAQDGIIIIEADSGKIMDVNPFLMNFLGYTLTEFVGKRLWEIGLFKDIAANKTKFAELQSKKYVRYENLPLETKSGIKKHVEFVSNVYLVGKTRIIQCNIRDIEDRIKAEEDAFHVEELKNMGLIDNAKTEFLNIVSHELKTPLTAIFANLELLEDITAQIPTANVLNLEALKRNSNQLKLIIDNILEISRMQSNKFELNITEIEPEKVIMSVMAEMKLLAQRKNIDLIAKIGKLPKLKTDESRFVEILNNLVYNAIKFTNKGQVELTAEKQEKFILISVIDTGIGIPKEKQKGIFQKFYQADSSIKRAYGGSGLGLSIVKKLVEALGGEVGFKSEVYKGSTFFFTLPLKMKEEKK